MVLALLSSVGFQIQWTNTIANIEKKSDDVPPPAHFK